MEEKDRFLRDTQSKMWYFIALCILAVNAQNSTESSPQKDSDSAKVEPKNISALYIGDLLRTKPKDDLEAAGSVHRPRVLEHDLLSEASVPYKSHGGHEYAESDYHPVYPEGRTVGIIKRTGLQAPSAPYNVKGHLLTLKPVRLVPADNEPTPRNPQRNHKEAHYPEDDCHKSSDRSYSSEEKPYAPETYRRAKQTASNSDLEYRSPPPSSYYDDDRSAETYSSHSDPSSGTYSSRAYPSSTRTKSESSGSYTTSKSTSTSKTVTPNKPKVARIIPKPISNKENFNKNYGTPHRGQGFVVYKVKEPSNQKPSSYSEDSEKDYPPPDYERDHKPVVREPHYSQHSSGPKKPRKYSHEKPSHYSSSEPKERPQEYGPSHYEEDHGSYDQSSYRPDEDQRYREQNKPPAAYSEDKYARPYSEREPENKPYQQNYQAPSDEPPYSNAKHDSKPYHSKKQLNTGNEKPSKRGRQQSGYRTRGSTPEYSHPHELQSSRGQKDIPQRNYETYPTQYSHTEASPTPQSYDRTQPSLRPSEKQPSQYEYEATPHQTDSKHSGTQSSHKRPYRESSRYARSPEQPTVIVEGRAQLPASGNEPVIMISRESKPYVSRSESFSESAYNMDDNKNPKNNYRRQEKPQATEGRHAGNPNYPISYKPFNSEYPASYANDPHHTSARKYAPRGYNRQSGPPPSYNALIYSHTDSHTDSHSGEPHQQYQQGESYDQEDNEGSYEEGGKPVKKSKNHHYISNIEGYKDTYGRDEPLVIDEAFFKKYGISPSAKVIVANAENPNLFVADGSNIKEGDYFKNSGPSSSSNYEPNPDSGYGPSSEPNSGPGYEANPDSGYGPSSAVSEENYEPGYKSDFKEDSFSSSQEEFGPKQIPGSFDDLVDTNPKFLRHLPQLLRNEDRFFKMDSTEAFDKVEFPKVGEQRGYIVSQGPGEIVQQHGDGVSRIVFNVPKVESGEGRSNAPKAQDKEELESRVVEAATNLIKDIIKSESEDPKDD